MSQNVFAAIANKQAGEQRVFGVNVHNCGRS